VFSSLGLKASGERDVYPENIVNRECLIIAVPDSYKDKDGNEKKTTAVPFDGYSHVDSEKAGSSPVADDDEEPPF